VTGHWPARSSWGGPTTDRSGGLQRTRKSCIKKQQTFCCVVKKLLKTKEESRNKSVFWSTACKKGRKALICFSDLFA